MSDNISDESREPLHPSSGTPLSPLERVLWRFRLAGHEATVLCRGFRNHEQSGKELNADLMFAFVNQSLLIVSKFREVWDDFGSVVEDDPCVVSVRRTVQPIVDRIDVWSGLRDHRNSTLAHAYLDSTGAIVPPTALIREGSVPTFHAEVLLLLQLVLHGVAVVLQAFEETYLEIDSVTRDGPLSATVDKGPGIEDGPEIDPELAAVMRRVEECFEAEFGCPLEGPILDGFRAALDRPSRSA